jgi:predicted permease
MRAILFRLAMLARRLRARLRRAAHARGLSDEMAFHVEMLTRDGIMGGLSPEDARTAALQKFGNRTTVTEESHDMWSLGWLDDLLRDAKLALCGFRRTPTFAVTAVLILGLGIGMATAMFTVFHAVLVRDLPVRDQNRIVVPRVFDRAGKDVAVSPEELDQIRRATRTMRDVAGVMHWGATAFPFTDGDRQVVLNRAVVTGNFFDVLGARPVLGRLLRSEDDVKGAVPVIVLSYRAWQHDFGGDPRVVGRRLIGQYFGGRYPIVGVAPPGLDYPAGVDFWVSITPLGSALMNVIGRLAPGATPAMVQSEFLPLVKRSRANNPFSVQLVRADARTFPKAVVGDVQPVLVVLTAAVALLLLIACVNVGNLLLLRAVARTRELAIRRALGASAGDIVRQLLVESGMLALGGGVLGLLSAELLLRVLLAHAPAQLPRTDVIRLAGAPLGVATAVTLLSVILFGLLPALSAARGGVGSTLRLDARSGRETPRRRRVRQLLVASQVALAVIVLAGAGLLARSLQRLEQIHLGYTPEHLSLFALAFPAADSSQAQMHATFEAVAPRLRAIPGITSLTPILTVPFQGANGFIWRVAAEPQTPAEAEANPSIPFEQGGPDYFRTFGIPLLRGRGFRETDRANAPHVAVVSEALAERFWPGQDPIGKRLHSVGDTTATGGVTVVGVAGDIRYRSLRRANPTIYLPWQGSWWQGEFAIRTTGRLASVLPAMRRVVREVDPRLSIWQAQTMDDLLGGPLAQPRLSTLLLSGFGLVALVLAALGLYGVMASAVREQTRELGIRLALGATPSQLRQRVIRHALVVTSTGAIVGLVGALISSRLLTSLLFQVSPSDPITLVGVCVLLIAVALTAAYLPARRATRVDPAQVLRTE